MRQTKLVLNVSIICWAFGQPADYDAIKAFADAHGMCYWMMPRNLMVRHGKGGRLDI